MVKLESDELMFEDQCYEMYRLYWMISHGETIQSYLSAIGEIAGTAVEEDPSIAPTNDAEVQNFLDAVEDSFECEHGFHGSLWSSKAEFLQCEFRDAYFMDTLFRLSDDYTKLWRFYQAHYLQSADEDKLSTYYVTFRVEGRYITKAIAKNAEEAIEKATDEYVEANFGELQDIDGNPAIVEDEDGNFVWEA